MMMNTTQDFDEIADPENIDGGNQPSSRRPASEGTGNVNNLCVLKAKMKRIDKKYRTDLTEQRTLNGYKYEHANY